MGTAIAKSNGFFSAPPHDGILTISENSLDDDTTYTISVALDSSFRDQGVASIEIITNDFPKFSSCTVFPTGGESKIFVNEPLVYCCSWMLTLGFADTEAISNKRTE